MEKSKNPQEIIANASDSNGWMKWQRTEEDSDPQLLEGIAASLRE